MEAMAKHRAHSVEFKRQVAQEFLAGETLHGLAKRHDISRNLILIASAIPGGKLWPYVWKNVRAWAEGFYHAGLKRTGQALELRLLLDEHFESQRDPLILVAGDFNAEDHETPLRIVLGAAEDTGNAELAPRSLVVLDRAVESSRRFSVVHQGRPQMLDHLLASLRLLGRFRGIEIHNEALGDEAMAYGKSVGTGASYHAAVVARFSQMR
jgi:hypothetical protein